jgi:glycosyltransferase involved in cell wall biosynthesis
LYAGRRARSTLETFVRSHPPDVAVVQMVRCGWALDVLERSSPETPVLFDAIDAMGLHYQRAARFVGPLVRPAYEMEATRCRRRERELARRSQLTTAVSQRDLEAVGASVGRVVPVAGRRLGASRRDPKRSEVLLSGNLGYRPTVQGALWFAREVWPEIRRKVSGARWVLAGARPARAIKRLGALDGVEIHGDVPDLAPFQARAAVSIAPMREGSGVPMKVLEAWAAGVPVIAHPWTADGLENAAKDGLVVADDPGEWVRAIVELLVDPDAGDRLAARGSTNWRRSYSPERIAGLVREVVCEAAES